MNRWLLLYYRPSLNKYRAMAAGCQPPAKKTKTYIQKRLGRHEQKSLNGRDSRGKVKFQ